jgi:hypothetical protein
MLSLQPIVQSATLARRVGVVLGSLAVTLYFCLRVIGLAATGRLDRARVDRYTRAWSRLLQRLMLDTRAGMERLLYGTESQAPAPSPCIEPASALEK